MHVTVKLYPAQMMYRHSAALYRGFVGGRGTGKSFVGAYDLMRRARPGRLYGVYAPTYPMLRDATLRSFLSIGKRMGFIAEYNKTEPRVTLGNGAEVIFRSLEDPEKARGPNLSGAWMDEASIVKKGAYDIIIACLREGGEQGWLTATFTPKGRQHWTFQVFGSDKPNTALFRARTSDNPFLPAGFYDTLRGQYTTQFAAQELEGEFVDLQGNLAKRDWFPIVDVVPADAQRVRAWDFAATEKSAKSDDPDYTVGTLLALSGGVYYVANVIRQRVGPGAVESLVAQTAHIDGENVSIIMEQEPGSAGKLFTGAMIRALAGYNIRAEPATGDKVARAMPLLAQAEGGNVRLVLGGWNADWLDEVAAMPLGAHDDQVDSASLAFHNIGMGSGIYL